MKTRVAILTLLPLVLLAWGLSPRPVAQTKLPPTTTLFGTLIDLSCAARGIAMRDSWSQATESDHVHDDGEIKDCARKCLLEGHPAALYDGKKKIVAVFACNPKKTLANYAAQKVDVQGFWVGTKKDDARSFVPRKIRIQGAKVWTDVECEFMGE